MALTPLVKGLSNSKSGSGTTPDSCVVLDNFFVTNSGQLIKRPGTEVVSTVSDGVRYFPKYLSSSVVLLSKSGEDIRVHTISGVVIKTFANLFSSAVDITFHDVDDPDFYAVVTTGDNCNPIQVNFTEHSYYHTAGNVAVVLPNWVAANVVVLDGASLVSASIVQVNDTLTISYGSSAQLTLLHITYSVWAPAQYFFGNEFFTVVTKSATQKSVIIPEPLVTDLEEVNQSLIKVFQADNTSLFSNTQQPRLPSDVAFSDGQEYEYSPSNQINFSPFFLTFGQRLYDVSFDLSILNIDTVNSVVTIQGHGLDSGMLVQFENEAPGNVTTNTSYVVVVKSSDSFSLETVAGAPVTFSSALSTTLPSYTFSSENIRQDGSVNIAGASFTGKKKVRLSSSVLLPSALENNKDYFITGSGGVVSFFDADNPDIQVLLNRIKTTSFDASSVDYLNNTINIPGHGYFNSQPVAVVDSTQLLNPLVLGVKYYVRVVDADKIQLYTDNILQNLIDFVITGTVSVNLNYTIAKFANNSFTVATHGFTNGQAVVIEDERPTVEPLEPNTIYFVKVVNANTFILCFDRNLRAEVDLFIPTESANVFSSTDVDTATDRITIDSHGYANSQVVMFLSSSLPAPLAPSTYYYVSVVDDNTIQLFTDSGLSSLVNLTTTGSSTYTIYKVVDYNVLLLSTDTNTSPIYLTDAWGAVKLSPEYQTGTISTVNFPTALLSRRRRIKFNTSTVRVIVDGVEFSRTSTQSGSNNYFVQDVNGTTQSLAVPVNKDLYIAFEASAVVGVNPSAFIEIFDNQKGSGMSLTFSIPTNFNQNRYTNGSFILKYGYADFFDISSPPTEITVSNNRLYLATDVRVVVSEQLDSLYNNRYYANLTIDDRLEGLATEPFYFVLSQGGSITKLIEFQNNLFIFTTRAVFRVDSPNAITFVVQNIANQGVSRKECVTKLQSFICYSNTYGVFLLTSDIQGLYYAQELSINISDRIKNNECVSLVFDPLRDSLYVFCSEKTFCYNIISQAWSIYRYPFRVEQAFFVDEVYLVAHLIDDTERFVKFTQTPLDLVVEEENPVVVNGTVWNEEETQVVIEKLSFTSDPSISEHVVPFAATKLQDNLVEPVNRVTNVATTFYINGVAILNQCGYEIQSLVISGAVHLESLNTQALSLHLMVSVELYNSFANNLSIGTIFGSTIYPEVFDDVIDFNDIPELASFVIVKESIQGMSNSYQFVAFSASSNYTAINGYDITPILASNNYYSGGK